MEAFHPRQITCFQVITQTEENNHLKQSSFCWRTNLNLKKTSSYCVAITNAAKLTEFMDFTMNAREDTVSEFGKSSRMFSTVCLLLLLLMIKFYACMEVCRLNWLLSHSCNRSQGQLKFQKTACSATFYGLTLRKVNPAGERTTEE